VIFQSTLTTLLQRYTIVHNSISGSSPAFSYHGVTLGIIRGRKNTRVTKLKTFFRQPPERVLHPPSFEREGEGERSVQNLCALVIILKSPLNPNTQHA